MKLLDLHKKVKQLFSRLDTVDKQWEYHDARKVSLIELQMYQWYKTIIEYREMEAEQAMTALSNVKTPKELIPYYQAKHNTAIAFLDWLIDCTA